MKFWFLKKYTQLIVLTTSLFMCGCAMMYSSDSTLIPVDPGAQLMPSQSGTVRLVKTQIPREHYELIGQLEVALKKRHFLVFKPRQERMDAELIKEAQSVGADAIMNIQYEKIKFYFPLFGGGLAMRHGGLKATGIAVKMKSDKGLSDQ